MRAFVETGLRVHPVVGDAMEPTLRGGRDFVLAVPVTNYLGEGLYLVDFGVGIEIFRITNLIDRLQLARENERYLPKTLSKDEFEEIVVGVVIADIRARHEELLTDMLSEPQDIPRRAIS